MQQYLLVLITILFSVLPVVAHEGSNAEHLAMGMGIGETLGLITGLVLGAGSVLFFAKYRNKKSGK